MSTSKKKCVKGLDCGMSCISKSKKCTQSYEQTTLKMLEDITTAINPVARKRKGEEILLGDTDYGKIKDTREGTAYKEFYETDRKQNSSEVAIASEIGKIGIGPKVLSVTKDKEGIIEGYEMENLKKQGYKGTSSGDEKAFNKKLWNSPGDSGLRAIAKLHTNGIYHGDIRGPNVMFKGKNNEDVKIVGLEYASKIQNESQIAKWASEIKIMVKSTDPNGGRPAVDDTPIRKLYKDYNMKLSDRNANYQKVYDEFQKEAAALL